MSEARFIVVDASVWVARLVTQDAFHIPVKSWFEAQRAQGTIFVVPSLLLVEVAGAISRRTGQADLAQQAVASLQQLPDLRLAALSQRLVLEAARQAASLGLRGADAFYVAIAAQLNLPLATLDMDQRAKAAATISIKYLGINNNP